jgi:hypothetical protein
MDKQRAANSVNKQKLNALQDEVSDDDDDD